MLSILLLALAHLSATSAAAGATHATLPETVTVRGIVYDSIARTPLADARVSLVGADSANATRQFSATSAADGTFRIPGVQVGRYVVGFYHPALDTLGLQAAERVVHIGPESVSVALATPSPETIITGFCGALNRTAERAAPGLLMGRVDDAQRESAVDSGFVIVTWSEARVAGSRITVADARGDTRIRGGGLFALCGVPRDVPILVRAGRGADSSGAIEARVPLNGLLYLSLSVGAVTSSGGRIVGRVLNEAHRPIRSAIVSLATSLLPQVATNDSGEFVLDSLPVGSQMLLVRAIGFAPRTTTIQVADGRATRADVVLQAVTVLSAVVSRDSVQQAHLAEFLYDEKHNATGSYFVQPIRLPGYEALQPVCHLINGLPGVPNCDASRGMAGCEGFVLNGHATSLDFADLWPDDILGVEVVRGADSKYVAELRKRLGRLPVCPVAVWTQCPGYVIPTCGTHPSVQPRPESANRDDQDTYETTRSIEPTRLDRAASRARLSAISRNRSLYTPAAVTAGPAPGPVITSGLVLYRAVVNEN